MMQQETIQRAYRTKVRATPRQVAYLVGCAGVARFVYNWALADRIARHEQGLSTNKFEQKKRFNALKHEQFPWLAKYPYVIVERAFDDLDAAYAHFFRRLKEGKEKAGFPRFKNRHTSRRSFCLGVNGVKIERGRVKLPRIGWLNLAEKGYLPTEGVKLNRVTISEQAGEWYISAQVEEPRPQPVELSGELAVHLGVRRLATLDDGTVFGNPRAEAKIRKRLARLNRELHRRQPGSANRRKTQAKLQKLHRRAANVRRHAQHDASAEIVYGRNPSRIIIQDWDVADMLASPAPDGIPSHDLHRAVADAGMGELRRQIEYKAGWHGSEVTTVARYLTVNRPCSRCGAVKAEFSLRERIYRCESCGLEIDRDDNAVRNLAA